MGVLPGTRGLSNQLSCLQEKARGDSVIKELKPCEINTWNSNLHSFRYIDASLVPLFKPLGKPVLGSPVASHTFLGPS